MSKNSLENIKNIHFIGVGGSGMCPLAEILMANGYTITGSDCNESDTLDRIKTYGIAVHMGHRAENIKGADLVVYTAAVKADNPELVAARENGIKTMERSEMLGVVTDKYMNSIAVSGTHGKTTTTSMLSHVLLEADTDPTISVGGILNAIGGNIRVGDSGVFVTEALARSALSNERL